MNITYDSAKARINLQKHGISLAIAEEIEWDTAITWLDLRQDYGEKRMAGIAYIGLRLYFVVFVDRADKRRIISLRKANLREVKHYANT